MDESTKQKFEEKLKELLEMAKAKKNVLEDVEVKAHFAGLNLEEEHMDKVYEMLDKNNVDLLIQISEEEEEPVDEELLMADAEELEVDVDLENLDLSVPEGVGIEDPVKMYLREIG
ncbi:MAG: RNA polymerase subunit sigma-70, partial [Lachnospiraceae bacterium]|nr:RNA polymerase subunit sigma-70 [Lachnospiraceae bacterium]